jgi:hypothetical protein
MNVLTLCDSYATARREKISAIQIQTPPPGVESGLESRSSAFTACV